MACDLEDKFRGAMVGALIGDCLGAPFEWRGQQITKKEFAYMLDPATEIFPYTDDTAMAFSLTEAILERRQPHPTDIMKKFIESYEKEPFRGYGKSTAETLEKASRYLRHHLNNAHFDPFHSAQSQFSGTGSKGNGAAMRIHPVALAGFRFSAKDLFAVVEQASKVTHCHKDAITWAYIQAKAVQLAMKCQTQNGVINGLMKATSTPYHELITRAARQDFKPRNGVLAADAVQAALHISLVKHDRSRKDYFKSVLFSVYSQGEDTDTVGCMAGAIAGAIIGYKNLPKVYKQCEGHEKARIQAEKLFSLSMSNSFLVPQPREPKVQMVSIERKNKDSDTSVGKKATWSSYLSAQRPKEEASGNMEEVCRKSGIISGYEAKKA